MKVLLVNGSPHHEGCTNRALLEVEQDGEGLFNMRVLGRNMAYFLKCQEAARSVGIPLPEQEVPVFTNFVRE